jgi:hypothetical protein
MNGIEGSAFNVHRQGYNNSKPQNRRTAEYRMSNVEGWIRFALAYLKEKTGPEI